MLEKPLYVCGGGYFWIDEIELSSTLQNEEYLKNHNTISVITATKNIIKMIFNDVKTPTPYICVIYTLMLQHVRINCNAFIKKSDNFC